MELKCDQITVTQSQPLEVLYQPAPTRFIFNEENKTQFNESLTSEHAKQTLESLGNEIMALQVNQTQDKKLITDSIKDINNKFTEHLRNIAAESFKQTKTTPRKSEIITLGLTGKHVSPNVCFADQLNLPHPSRKVTF